MEPSAVESESLPSVGSDAGMGTLRVAHRSLAWAIAAVALGCSVDPREPQIVGAECGGDGALQRCSGDFVQRCLPSGSWSEELMPCALGCVAGRCVTPGGSEECPDGECTAQTALNPCEGEACGECSPGERRNCVEELGDCALGEQFCRADSRWSTCSVQPAPGDTCEPVREVDCAGQPDDTCACVPGDTEACDVDTDGVGICRAGERTCIAGPGGSDWGPCLGSVQRAPRNCGSVLDNDCNGIPDRDDASCSCVLGTTRQCGRPGCLGVETCEASSGGTLSGFGECDLPAVVIPDPAFEALVRSQLSGSVPAGQPIDGNLLSGIFVLNDFDSGIESVEGIECMSELRELLLRREALDDGDLARIAATPSIVRLDLFDNRIVDASPLRALENLRFLDLQATDVVDASWLRNHPSLEALILAETGVTDISFAPSLSQLDQLFLNFSPVADVSPLASLPPLRQLGVAGLPIADLSLLSAQRELDTLMIGGTAITDLSLIPVQHPALTLLDLTGSTIGDLSPLLSLSQLDNLRISATGADCESPVVAELAARVTTFFSGCPGF